VYHTLVRDLQAKGFQLCHETIIHGNCYAQEPLTISRNSNFDNRGPTSLYLGRVVVLLAFGRSILIGFEKTKSRSTAASKERSYTSLP
jgi:hypothetical protein